MKIRSKAKKFVARLLIAILLVSVIPVFSNPITADAASNKTVACLGTSAIKTPSKPSSANDAWKGNYVWYGKYNGNPVKYRVLSPSTTTFGGKTMLLDSDSILYTSKFYPASTKTYNWKNSTVRSGLNGSTFLKKKGVFTNPEYNAITASKVESHKITVGSPLNKWVTKTTALTGERVFVLDFEDVCSPSYGYINVIGSSNSYNPYPNTGNSNNPYAGQPSTVPNRYKKNTSGSSVVNWWLRDETSSYGDANSALYTETNGAISGLYSSPSSCGVSPAFNVNLSSVLFSSLVSGSVGKDNAEYKLTLVDKKMTIKISTGKKISASGNKVTIPYTIKGDDSKNATQVSVLITDKEYKAGNTKDAKIKYYGKLNVSKFATSGTGTFTMPSGLDIEKWGTDYLVYIIAEDVNGAKETDYASEPVKITAPLRPAIEAKVAYHSNGIKVSWPKVNGATKYKVFRKLDGGTWEQIKSLTSTSFVDKKDIYYGDTYRYYVIAQAGDGSQITEKSNGTKYKYLAPAPDITLENWEEGVRVSWKKVSGANKYRVYKKTGSNDWAKAGEITGGTTFIDTSAEPGISYRYAVVGVDKRGIEMNDYSNKQSIVRNDQFVRVNYNITAEGVELNWDVYQQSTKYRVYRKNALDGGWAKLGTVINDTSYIDTNVKPNKEYYYAVVAVNDSDVMITERGRGLCVKYVVPPTEVNVYNKTLGIKAEWSSVANASKYTLYRKTKSTSWTKITTTTAFGYLDKSAEIGKTYYYSVIALDANGNPMNDYREDVSIKRIQPINEDAEVLAAPICVEIEDEETAEEIIEEEAEEETSEEDSEEETSEEDSEEETSEEDSEEETSEEDSEEETSEEDSEEETSEEDSEEEDSEEETAEEEGTSEATEETIDEGNVETVTEDASAEEGSDAAEIVEEAVESAVEE